MKHIQCNAMSSNQYTQKISSSKITLPVLLAIPSRGPGGDEKQPELLWPSELPADTVKRLCFPAYVVAGFALL